MYRAAVEDWEQDRAMVDAVVADFGHVDILVNNAGIASRGRTIFDTDPAELERVVRIHAFGSFYLSKLVLPSMRQRPRGDIIMISSTMMLAYAPNSIPYSMGKAGMEAVARVLGKEERANNIRVNILQPGIIESEMGVRLAKATRGSGDWEELAPSLPWGHAIRPNEIADAVRFLVSDAGFYITGATIRMDGGGNLQY
jgi:NAD(P)-dependent dehydrogenase (short-subunit alcohol dehydrogenase family)